MSAPDAHRLIVMRHAKAEATNVNDRSRRLTGRGKADARAVGRWLAEEMIAPDVVLVSPAVRAQQTAEQVGEEAGWSADLRVVDTLYFSDVDDVIDLLHDVDAGTGTVMVVGHNPTFEALVWTLQRNPATKWPANLPTSGTVVLGVEGPWSQLAGGGATIVTEHLRRG